MNPAYSIEPSAESGGAQPSDSALASGAGAASLSTPVLRACSSAPHLTESRLPGSLQLVNGRHERLPANFGSVSQRMTVNDHTVVCLSADITPLHLSAAVTDCGLDMQEIKSKRTNTQNSLDFEGAALHISPAAAPVTAPGADISGDKQLHHLSEATDATVASFPANASEKPAGSAAASPSGGTTGPVSRFDGAVIKPVPGSDTGKVHAEADNSMHAPGSRAHLLGDPVALSAGTGVFAPATDPSVATAATLLSSSSPGTSGVTTTLLPQKPLILIIITGGTICMDYGGELSSMRPTRLAQRLQDLPEMRDPNLPYFDVLEWDTLVDSSEIGLPQWRLLAQQIHNFYGDYDGFVVLHGTDTMAYTAAALSFMLENLGKPVVMTGAMLPMMHISTDAKRNLAVSMMMAGYSQLTELVVIFGSRVLRGTRVSKVDCSRIDAFESPNFPALGCVGVDVVLHDELLLKPPVRGFRIFTQFCLNVAVVPITPFLPVDRLKRVFEDPKRPLAVVLQLYGSGTAPSTKELLDTIKAAIENGINIVATTQCRRGSANLLAYESGVWLSNLGVINGKDLTLEACVAKLAYLMGKGYTGAPLKDLMESDIRGELTESPNKVSGVSNVLDVAEVQGDRSKSCVRDEKREMFAQSPSQGGNEEKLVSQNLGACTLYRHRPRELAEA
ncbi:putative L-asparaginase [Toxoplasma gondii GAB2-2007-GAL-DOM2]|uniref:asparaginase n=5 Tax=Toxoplasma gondii TaxID=5811 RepID=S7UQK9_TOXGG|nr:putative L-asparaginase [Toxoplasma gondii GT1]KAF4644364.1 putative L-asparaginase [Toxoplasma gondii]KFG42747.1 putative L-asparaginase [Toxoplasma gondii GAB2-2007-GAL-DOM2]KFG53236.1 putative L-asparaginase [Toxoplasma gondii FOU]RQX73838.1 putative L-asparaginase [Toxoplasma gondii CAST]